MFYVLLDLFWKSYLSTQKEEQLELMITNVYQVFSLGAGNQTQDFGHIRQVLCH